MKPGGVTWCGDHKVDGGEMSRYDLYLRRIKKYFQKEPHKCVCEKVFIANYLCPFCGNIRFPIKAIANIKNLSDNR